jgi:iron complex outermembrane receptor protein
LKGLGASIGVDYRGRCPGSTSENIAGETLATPAGVPNQPSFYIAPRTLVQAGVHYRGKRWNLTLMVHNLTNRDYIRAVVNRLSMEPGEPRNISASVQRTW